MFMSARQPAAALCGCGLLLLATPTAAIEISLQHGAQAQSEMGHSSSSAQTHTFRLGVQSRSGVTHYKAKATKAQSGPDFYNSGQWPMSTLGYTGPTDFIDNVSWGWHHPNGQYNTIPIGAPLIDENLSIYVGSDDAIRKFDALGNLEWIYAPRGQLASAPGLIQADQARRKVRPRAATADSSTEAPTRSTPSAPREVKIVPPSAEHMTACVDDNSGIIEVARSIGETLDGCSEAASMCKHSTYGPTVRALCCFTCAAADVDEQVEGEIEDIVAPTAQEGALQMGDRVKVMNGNSYYDSGVEYFKGNDEGVVSSVFTSELGEERVMIHWLRTGRQSSASRRNWAWRLERTSASSRSDANVAFALKQRASTPAARATSISTERALEAKSRSKRTGQETQRVATGSSQGTDENSSQLQDDAGKSFEDVSYIAASPATFEERELLGPPVSVLVGSTNTGYVFAIDLDTGKEVWATKTSAEISGVKGSVAGMGGIVVAATNRCRDRYCFRYRNETQNLEPGNSFIRGLSSADGSHVWEYKPASPVWNFVPLFLYNTVMFQDYEASLYSLNLTTGKLRWKSQGTMGTVTQAAASLSPDIRMVYSLGVKKLVSRWCNPATPPGILIQCSPNAGTQGIVRAYNAINGEKLWELDVPHVPAGGTVGKVMGYGRYVLAVGMGISCRYNSPTALWVIDAKGGGIILRRGGPTLWTGFCAGDREGADIRRAMGSRTYCSPNSWSEPVIDKDGSIFIGNQIGELQKWGSPDGWYGTFKLMSTLSTGVAFQDQAIAMAPGMMALTTCTSLIVMQTDM